MKNAAFALFDAVGGNALFRARNRGKIKVLLYHNVTEGGAHFDYAITPEAFDAHLRYLKRHYNFVGMNQAGGWTNYRADRVNVLLTFDDGFRNNLTHALPILQRHGVPALFFLIADCVADGSPPSFMIERIGERALGEAYRTVDPAEAKQLLAAGMTIGSHSINHSNHAELPDEEALADGRAAQQMLEATLGVPVKVFAFPWGHYRAGQPEGFLTTYDRVFLTEHGFANPGDKVLPRNEVANLAQLKAAASGGLDGLRRLVMRSPATAPADRPLHIALAIPTMAGGGAERVQLELMHGLVARGHRVDLLLLENMGELLPLIPPEVRIVDLAAPRIRRAFRTLRRYLKQERPDVLFVSLWPLTAVAVGAAAGLGHTRVVTVEHNRLDEQFADRPGALFRLRRSIRMFYPRAAGRVAVSQGVAAEVARMAGLPTSAVDVIYNPIPAPPAGDPDPVVGDALWHGHRGPRILTVGKFKEQKNHPLLLEAFALLSDLDARLAILGNGPLEADTRTLAERMGLGERALFPGFAIDPAPWFQSADLFVLSSDYEGFGNVIVEAMHHGLNVVSTDCNSGPAEILDGETFGTLAPVGDAAALADAIRRALKAPRDPAALKRRAAEFSAERAVAAYADLAQRVVAR